MQGQVARYPRWNMGLAGRRIRRRRLAPQLIPFRAKPEWNSNTDATSKERTRQLLPDGNAGPKVAPVAGDLPTLGTCEGKEEKLARTETQSPRSLRQLDPPLLYRGKQGDDSATASTAEALMPAQTTGLAPDCWTWTLRRKCTPKDRCGRGALLMIPKKEILVRCVHVGLNRTELKK